MDKRLEEKAFYFGFRSGLMAAEEGFHDKSPLDILNPAIHEAWRTYQQLEHEQLQPPTRAELAQALVDLTLENPGLEKNDGND